MQVEHRGVMPSLVPKPGSYLQIVDQRKQLREVIWSCWPAVSQPSPHQPDLAFVVRLHAFYFGIQYYCADVNPWTLKAAEGSRTEMLAWLVSQPSTHQPDLTFAVKPWTTCLRLLGLVLLPHVDWLWADSCTVCPG